MFSAATDHETPEIVGTDALERELAAVRAAAAGPAAGIFGPQSMTWLVDREAAIFLGAGRALLLQLAHPWVAAAIAQHSDAFDNPVGRFHRTFGTVFTMLFGNLEQSLEAARRLHRRHAAISGALRSPAGPFAACSFYRANSLPALRWVHATLIDTALMTHALVLPALTPQERERYHAESRSFAALFGLPPASLADSWAAFCTYFDTMVRSDTLTVTPDARAMAHRLLAGTDGRLPVPASYRALTAELLPPRLRDDFALPYGEAERRKARRLIGWLRWIYPSLPRRLRTIGPYQEAEQRLGGRERPDLAVRLSNRLWIGRDRLPG
jgi:uncharacterized protein (DUF2236 family)